MPQCHWTARDYLLTLFACERLSGRFHKPQTRTAATLFKCRAQVRHFQKCLPVSCRIKGGTFSPFFLPPLLDPGEGCVIVCVFIFPGTRPAVGWICVCGAGGELFPFFFFWWSGPGARFSWTEAICSVSRGVHSRVQRWGNRVEVCSPKLLYSLWCTANWSEGTVRD